MFNVPPIGSSISAIKKIGCYVATIAALIAGTIILTACDPQPDKRRAKLPLPNRTGELLEDSLDPINGRYNVRINTNVGERSYIIHGPLAKLRALEEGFVSRRESAHGRGDNIGLRLTVPEQGIEKRLHGSYGRKLMCGDHLLVLASYRVRKMN